MIQGLLTGIVFGWHNLSWDFWGYLTQSEDVVLLPCSPGNKGQSHSCSMVVLIFNDSVSLSCFSMGFSWG